MESEDAKTADDNTDTDNELVAKLKANSDVLKNTPILFESIKILCQPKRENM